MVQILGWFRAEAACASRSKRLRACESAGEPVGKELQGDKAVQLYVLGLIDHAHTTAAELLYDAIVRNGLAEDG